MRVTHVITRLIVGGAQENTVASVLGLRTKPGLEVDLIAGPTTGPEGSLEDKFAPFPQALTIAPHLLRPVRPFQDCLALGELRRMLRDRRPDLVHTHSGKAGVLGRLAAHQAGVPIVVHTIHGPSFGPFQNALSNWIFTAAERWAARWTTHFVSVADAMTGQYLQAGIGRPEQFTRIFSGFSMAPFQSAENSAAIRAQLGIDPADFVIAKIARLAELKGHDDLLDAASAIVAGCPPAKFLLIGDGPRRGAIEARINALGLRSRFVLAGLIAPEEIPGLLGVANVVVHLSRREGLPRALSQALAAGKPVVAYDCDGAKEVCLPDETGFLIAPGDTAVLAQRLLQLAREPALCLRLGQRGRQLVKDAFTLERMVDALHSLYLKLAAESSGRGRPVVSAGA